MRIELTKNNLQQQNKSKPAFGGPLDGIITSSLVTIDTNPMANAAIVDLFAMVGPRTYVDTKKRNKYAGGETFFRELTGTFIVCLSSGYIAKGIANLYNRFKKPETKLNPNTWVSNDSLNLLTHSWEKSKGVVNKVETYVSNVLSNISGVEGKGESSWKNIDWEKTEWFDEKKWDGIKWHNPKFNNIQNKLKSESQIVRTLAEVIEDKNINSSDVKNVLEIVEHRVANALKVGSSINVKLDDKSLDSSVKNLIRDVHDLGKDIFTNKSLNIDAALTKLKGMNKVKTLGALSIASSLGLVNQYINRKITQKRTGTDAFVGDVDYKKSEKGSQTAKTQDTTHYVKQNKGFLGLKLLASAGIVALAAGVMKIKNPKDFVKKLEFTGPITSGNAIKTVYTATLVGRFMASKDKTELRESVTRDYLGFLNWLVLGGFAAKGVAQLLDRKQNNLFNVHKQGGGLKHWLNDISLKSHAEIASKGGAFAKKNIWKLNVSHAAGLAYSTLALGFLLPLLNIAVTKKSQKKDNRNKVIPSAANTIKTAALTPLPAAFKEFM